MNEFEAAAEYPGTNPGIQGCLCSTNIRSVLNLSTIFFIEISNNIEYVFSLFSKTWEFQVI